MTTGPRLSGFEATAWPLSVGSIEYGDVHSRGEEDLRLTASSGTRRCARWLGVHLGYSHVPQFSAGSCRSSLREMVS
jgi:hypothetical protein